MKIDPDEIIHENVNLENFNSTASSAKPPIKIDKSKIKIVSNSEKPPAADKP